MERKFCKKKIPIANTITINITKYMCAHALSSSSMESSTKYRYMNLHFMRCKNFVICFFFIECGIVAWKLIRFKNYKTWLKYLNKWKYKLMQREIQFKYSIYILLSLLYVLIYNHARIMHNVLHEVDYYVQDEY